MKLELRQATPSCVVVTCRGGLSWEDRDALTERIAAHLDGHGGVKGVILDLADIEFINSAGLGALFQLAQSLRARSATLVFANTSPALQRLFRTVGLQHFARIGDELNAVLGSFDNAAQLSPATNEQPPGQAPSTP